MRIAAVRPAAGHVVLLLCDNGEELAVDKTVWEESPLRVGSSLSHEEAEALCAESERRRTENKAVFLLAKRDLSRRELEQKLCREKGKYRPERREAAAKAAARMEELGYVNDTAYARRLAERYAREKLWPSRRIAEALVQKGIARDEAHEAAAAVGIDEAELALAFLRKKRYTVPQNTNEFQRIAAAMVRYGYSPEVVRRVLRQWEDEWPNE